MDEYTARAHYDTALAQYTEALARLESGDQTPGLVDYVHALYGATLTAHAALVAAAQDPDAGADATPSASTVDAGTAQLSPAVEILTDGAPERSRAQRSSADSAPVTPEPIAPVPSAIAASSPTESASVPNVSATDAPVAAASQTVPATATFAPPRRSGLSRFSPPAASAPAEQALRRDVLTSERSAKRSEIGTERKLAGNLPEWSPLPPGEIFAPARR